MPPVRYREGEFPPKELDLARLVPLIGPASAALARYDALLTAVPNPQVLLSPLTTQEAVLSSRIEGTVATMGEVMQYDAGAGPDASETERVSSIQEVSNYRKAMRQATALLEDTPLSGRVIKAAHQILMSGVRGQNRAPGEYRRGQNMIGPPGCTTEQEATYIPVAPVYFDQAMGRWENYLHSDQPDILVQLAIVHVEFEAVHPFWDGNGRLGRMLIPLFLYGRKVLSAPTFYISAYLEAHRDEYYERLLAVSRDGDWLGWCEFFLKALIAQAGTNIGKARDILALYAEKKEWIMGRARSVHQIRALDFIFDRPVFRTSDFVQQAGIPRRTAYRVLQKLTDGGLLRDLRAADSGRATFLLFPELLNIAEGRKVF